MAKYICLSHLQSNVYILTEIPKLPQGKMGHKARNGHDVALYPILFMGLMRDCLLDLPGPEKPLLLAGPFLKRS